MLSLLLLLATLLRSCCVPAYAAAAAQGTAQGTGDGGGPAANALPALSIAIVQLYTPEVERYAQYSVAMMRAYCSRHGYTHIVHTRALDANRAPAWSKILAVQQAVASGAYDWVMWMDADAAVVHPQLSIEGVLQSAAPESNLAMLVSQDPPQGHEFINTGVWLVRGRSEAAEQLLRDWYDSVEELPASRWGLYWEQTALNFMGSQSKQVQRLVKVLPFDWFGCPLRLALEPNVESIRSKTRWIAHFHATVHELRATVLRALSQSAGLQGHMRKAGQ